MMDVTRISLQLFILASLCLYSLGKALKSCRSRSSRCRLMEKTFSITATPTDFRCPGKGHFAVPGDVFSFYRCGGSHYEPCICTCKHEQMCFDVTRRRCRFAFLESVQNCSHVIFPEAQNSRHRSFSSAIFTTPGFAIESNSKTSTLGLPSRSKARDTPATKTSKNRNNINEVLKDKEAQENQFDSEKDTTTVNGSIISFPTDSEVLAAHHAAKKVLPQIIEDNSWFPAWAISLLVLCVVIALVLVVMVLY